MCSMSYRTVQICCWIVCVYKLRCRDILVLPRCSCLCQLCRRKVFCGTGCISVLHMPIWLILGDKRHRLLGMPSRFVLRVSSKCVHFVLTWKLHNRSRRVCVFPVHRRHFVRRWGHRVLGVWYRFVCYLGASLRKLLCWDVFHRSRVLGLHRVRGRKILCCRWGYIQLNVRSMSHQYRFPVGKHCSYGLQMYRGLLWGC